MKILCTAALAVASAVLCPAGALAQDNSATFTQTQGSDGLFHVDVGVSYNFPGLPPRTNSSGVGTVRVTLPDAVNVRIDPATPADPGYSCAPSANGGICSADGTPNPGGGFAFPSSMTMHLMTSTCWSGRGTADVWAAPTDPGTAPDVSLPVQAGECIAGDVQQPVLDTKALKCHVPKLKNVSLPSAIRRLNNAKCARGKVRYVRSKVKKGRVISQSVRSGTLLKENGKVNLVVSRGPH